MNKTDLAIVVSIAVILGGVMAASFTQAYLLGPNQAFAAQEQGQPADASLLVAGQNLFAVNCAGCHFADKTEEKYGPGFMGLSKTKKLPTSGRDATEDNIRAQLKSPIKSMPKFDKLTDQEIKSLVAHLLSL